jgi:transposase
MVREYVLPASTVYTDELRNYGGIGALKDDNHWPVRYDHRRINHSAGVYVMGDIHANSVEGFWSLLKRGIGGTYHSVSQKFLHSYLNEYAFRYNHRDDLKPMFMNFMERVEKG